MELIYLYAMGALLMLTLARGEKLPNGWAWAVTIFWPITTPILIVLGYSKWGKKWRT